MQTSFGAVDKAVVVTTLGNEKCAPQIAERYVALPRAHIDGEHRLLGMAAQFEVRARRLKDFGLKVEVRVTRATRDGRLVGWL